MMAMQVALNALITRTDLSREQMRAAMQCLMQGEATPAQIGGFLTALRMKGETVIEITEAARVMREFAEPVHLDPADLVDIVGTGGDGASIFNVSTASAFIAAAAGVKIAKHGNRSVSSKSGAADVLEAAGVNLNLDASQVARCVNEINVGFMFAPRHHAATKNVIGPRRELGFRSMFNLLGPLTNPARAERMVLGVFASQWVRPVCEVMQALGAKHVLVVHSEDGLDEFSIAAPTHVAELYAGEIREYRVDAQTQGLQPHALDSMKVADARDSLAMIDAAYRNEHAAAHEMLALNAGAAIYVGAQAQNLREGIVRARECMRTGAARAKLDQFITLTQHLANPP